MCANNVCMCVGGEASPLGFEALGKPLFTIWSAINLIRPVFDVLCYVCVLLGEYANVGVR